MRHPKESAHRSRSLPTFLLVLVIIGPALTGAATNAHDVAEGPIGGFAKVDPTLLAMQPDARFRILVTGAPHSDLDDLPPERAVALEILERRAAPFFEGVASLAAAKGGTVVATYPAAPAALIQADTDLMHVLAASDLVHHLQAADPPAVSVQQDSAAGAREPAGPQGDALETADDAQAANTAGRGMMQADAVWDLGHRGEGVRVAALGTGIDPTHEAFRHANGTSRIVAWADCTSGNCDSSGTSYDDHGHTTYTTASAAGGDAYADPDHGNFEEAGVAPAADLLSAKFLTASGTGTWAAALAAFDWAFANGADVTLNAWGGGSCTSEPDWAVYNTIKTYTDLGMLSVFSAGGSGPGPQTVGFPACMEATLSVGAIDGDKNVSPSSSRGPCTDPGSGQTFVCPDAVALGAAVRSAVPRGTCSLCDPSGYRTLSGTSPAAAFGAGYAALAEGLKLDRTGTGWDTAERQEREVLMVTAEDLGPAGPDNATGYGLPQLLNVYALANVSEEARILSHFSIQRALVHQDESNLLRFSVRNVGQAAANGTFRAALEHPDGATEVLREVNVSLGLLDREAVRYRFQPANDLQAGTYQFSGTFAYSWWNETAQEPENGTVSHTGTFEVQRVLLRMDLEGLAPRNGVGRSEPLTFTMQNDGNAAAQDLTLTFTVPDSYLFIPGTSVDPSDLNSRYSDPPPDRVVEDPDHDRTILIWDLGGLDADGSFSFTTEVVPTFIGIQRFVAVASYEDETETTFFASEVWRQHVVVVP